MARSKVKAKARAKAEADEGGKDTDCGKDRKVRSSVLASQKISTGTLCRNML